MYGYQFADPKLSALLSELIEKLEIMKTYFEIELNLVMKNANKDFYGIVYLISYKK